MAKCAFGRFLLRGAFDAQWPFATELYGRMLYVESDDTQVLIVAMDTLSTAQADADRFRCLVAEKTGIPAENIWYHELQVHAAPESPQMAQAMPELASRAAAEALAMQARAVPFTCEVAEAEMGDRFSMNREQYVEGLGGVTVWAGIRFDEAGRAYCNDPSRMLLYGYQPDLPVFGQPIYFDNPVDNRAYLFVFRDEEGRVIGTMSRFAAHPDVAVLFESHGMADYHYHYDWTGCLSEALTEHFGAPSLYLNGPCGDLATRKGFDGITTFEASAAECQRIGDSIAAALLARYGERRVSLGDADELRATMFTVELPMRASFPHTLADDTQPQRAAEAKAALQQAIDSGALPSTVKRLIDEHQRVQLDPHVAAGQAMFSEETLRRRTVLVKVAALKLGDYLFVGVPGECLVDMTLWLRATFTGVKTIPVDQVNGYFGYMATPRSLTLGGYTYWFSWVSREAIPCLKAGIADAMGKWL